MKYLLNSFAIGGFVLLGATAARAQIRFSGGPLAGLTVATAHFTRPSSASGTSSDLYRMGFAAGLTGAVESGHFALVPSALYCQEGFHTHQEDSGSFSSENNVRLDYLKFPLNLTYCLRATGQGPRVFAGGYVSFLQGGRQSLAVQVGANSSGGAERPVVAGDTFVGGSGNYYAHSTDAGLQGGLGYLAGGVLVQASYSVGRRNIAADQYPAGGAAANGTLYNRSFQVAVAYLFGTVSENGKPAH
ncbi:outer membrane beta-barrel protein [Hymenobacter nivis]|uniref:Outer membrane protein beta-barrel domain-containing protein n=1 Tax=Hymenobacter nivis TaxID=1850093 RepID=A0A2Z3GU22_9BACT|nr:outer membrane beta-barrel protein [Hymenobacter nivis]AWM32190.1 hypothetical protein DDQ68_04915 [Hymenobacter nivis]